jgi:hypothetical protein
MLLEKILHPLFKILHPLFVWRIYNPFGARKSFVCFYLLMRKDSEMGKMRVNVCERGQGTSIAGLGEVEWAGLYAVANDC